MDKKITSEELLKPRYKVIADWPESKFSSDDSPASMASYWVGRIVTYGEVGVQTQIKYDSYPHLFKKLEWWEDRKESEMPKYLKYATQKFSIKPFVVYPAIFTKEGEGWTVEVDKHIIPHGNYLKDKLPASEEEFNNQKLNS